VFAIIAAILFGLALLLDLLKTSLGDVITVTTLMLAGLLFVALHLGGAGAWRGGWRSRRRR
jgi:hypothetical protein